MLVLPLYCLVFLERLIEQFASVEGKGETKVEHDKEWFKWLTGTELCGPKVWL